MILKVLALTLSLIALGLNICTLIKLVKNKKPLRKSIQIKIITRDPLEESVRFRDYLLTIYKEISEMRIAALREGRMADYDEYSAHCEFLRNKMSRLDDEIASFKRLENANDVNHKADN